MSLAGLDDTELRQLVRDLARETLERYREINLLYRASETIGACLNTAAVPALVLQEADGVISAPAAAVVLGIDRAVVEKRGEYEAVSSLLTASQELVERVIESGRPDIEVWDSAKGSTAQISSALCVPIRVGEIVLGAVVLGRPAHQPPFTASDEKLLLGLASQAGVALERARFHEQEMLRRSMEEELAVARRIQLSLLPARLPRIEGWTFAAAYSAARQVGGDFYDFMDHALDERRLGFVIADVAGKGVPAALMMGFSRAVLRTESMAGRAPAELLDRANRLILSDGQARPFVSAFYAEIDLESGLVMYANAGHDAPLLLSRVGGSRSLDAPGVILGAFDGVEAEQHELVLQPGEALVFYTDGVTEARDPTGGFFGDERLLAAAAADTDSAQSVLDSVVSAVAHFTGGAEQADDLTIVIIQRSLGEASWNE